MASLDGKEMAIFFTSVYHFAFRNVSKNNLLTQEQKHEAALEAVRATARVAAASIQVADTVEFVRTVEG